MDNYNSQEYIIRNDFDEVYSKLTNLEREGIFENGVKGEDIIKGVSGKMLYKKNGTSIDYFISIAKLPNKLELTFFSKKDNLDKIMKEVGELIGRELI